MGTFSIFEKLRARKKMLDAAFTNDNSASTATPSVRPKGTKRVPHRDPETQKILWKDVPDE